MPQIEKYTMLRQVKLSACEKFCRKNTPSAIRQKFENFEKKRKDPRESPDVVLQKHNERRDRFTKYCEASQMTENDVSNFDTADDLTKPDTPATSLQQEEEEQPEVTAELPEEATTNEIHVDQPRPPVQISEPVAAEWRPPQDPAPKEDIHIPYTPPLTSDPRLIFPVLPEMKVFQPYTKKVQKMKPAKPKRSRTPQHNRGFLSLEQLEQSKSPFRNRVQNKMNYSRHVQFVFDSDDDTQSEPEIHTKPIIQVESPTSSPKLESPRKQEEPRKFSPRKKPVDTAEFVQMEGELMKQETIYKSNRDAITDCIKARVGDPLQRQKMLTVVKLSPSAHFILLLAEPLRMIEGVYRVINSDKAQRLCGDVKPELSPSDISGWWRYNGSTKSFTPQQEKSFTAFTDAVSVVV